MSKDRTIARGWETTFFATFGRPNCGYIEEALVAPQHELSPKEPTIFLEDIWLELKEPLYF
jgi:hypothetical protein